MLSVQRWRSPKVLAVAQAAEPVVAVPEPVRAVETAQPQEQHRRPTRQRVLAQWA
ncbi:MAG TPA: hypothetical protein VGL45_13685 [Bradyrhizobium sp.]